LLLKLSRVGPGRSLDGRPDAAGLLLKLSRVGPWMGVQILLEVVLEDQKVALFPLV
jgi:hypothetical protein